MISLRTYTNKELIRLLNNDPHPTIRLLIQRLELAEVSNEGYTNIADELGELREQLHDANNTITELEAELQEYR
jgi:hypothetical protein